MRSGQAFVRVVLPEFTGLHLQREAEVDRKR